MCYIYLWSDLVSSVLAHFDSIDLKYIFAGITGSPLQAYIFMGPIYYQKLKHMVRICLSSTMMSIEFFSVHVEL